MGNLIYPPDWRDDDDEIQLPDTCPNCGNEYDEIDYEFQICHICKFNNNGKETST